jgi:hypothetical protein
MYYQPTTGATFAHHFSIRQAMSWVLFGDIIADTDLVEQGIFPLTYEKPPVEPGQIAKPLTVELVNEQWTQLWTVRDATLEEIEAMKPTVPGQVTMRQARLALFRIGLLDQVAPAIESLEGAEREAARIEWEFSSTVVRDRPLVKMLGNALGLDDKALDQLFITAAEL